MALDHAAATRSAAPSRPPIERRSTTGGGELSPCRTIRRTADLADRVSEIVSPLAYPYAIDGEVRLDLSRHGRHEAAHLDEFCAAPADHDHESMTINAHRGHGMFTVSHRAAVTHKGRRPDGHPTTKPRGEVNGRLLASARSLFA